MNAFEIAMTLGGARREGQNIRCHCPVHGGGSLTLRDGDGGRLLVKCWGGCDPIDVLAELRRRGLVDGCAGYSPRIISKPRSHDDASRVYRALSIWRNAKDGTQTIMRGYLATRGIEFDHWPPSIRFNPCCPRPRDHAGNLVSPLPAMVGLVEHAARGPVAVHCTYLQSDGSGKADVEKPKAIFGSAAGGAVRFGLPRAGQWLAVAEGIETALSVSVACSMPAWAALSADGIRKLVLPPAATHVLVAADNDANGIGQSAANSAGRRLLFEGRHVRIVMPPKRDSDFNDLLRNGLVAIKEEARHVAARRS
jgi:hypothetical protein